MKYLILFFGMLSINAYADISGKWTGQGEWTYQGSGANCYMTLNFEDKVDSLIRRSGYFDCTVAGLEIVEAIFLKKGNELLNSDGEVVGAYEKNSITLSEVYSESVKVESTMKIDSLHMDYNEKWIGKDNSEIYDIKGRLFTSK